MATQRGQAAYIADMMSDPEPEPELGPSEIVSFYAGCNVFITGASGFIGKLLVEKLLRCCPDIRKLYILMRPKKGKNTDVRFKEQFDDPLYERLKCEQPEFRKKLIMIEGDMSKEDIDLSPEDREALKETHVLFHAAASVRFDDKIRMAVNTNVKGTKHLILFAKEMRNLKAFVYISTAFSHCPQKTIDEKFYPPPIDSDKILMLLDMLDDDMLNHMTPKLLGKWPNTYAFTKAVAEDAVHRSGTGLPICIVRPSIVISTSKEPIRGWIDNLYGPTGVVVGAGIGLLRSLYCNPSNIADIIPADYVINNIVAAAWDVAQTQSMNQNTENMPKTANDAGDLHDPPIYNTVSSCQKPIIWSHFMKLNEVHGEEVPTVHCLWCYCFTLNKYLWVHNIYLFFLHTVPATIIDFLARLTGREPMLLNAYKKIHKFADVISYFSTQEWKFYNNRVIKLWEKLGPADRALFFFNLEDLDWEDHFYHSIRGLRLYIAKDPYETLPQGQAKYAKLKAAHYTIVTVLSGLLLWGVVALLRLLLW